MHATHLECTSCHAEYEAGKLHNLCTKCGKPLYPRYDLTRISKIMTKAALRGEL